MKSTCTVIMPHIAPHRLPQTPGRYQRETQLAAVMVPGESGREKPEGGGRLEHQEAVGEKKQKEKDEVR